MSVAAVTAPTSFPAVPMIGDPAPGFPSDGTDTSNPQRERSIVRAVDDEEEETSDDDDADDAPTEVAPFPEEEKETGFNDGLDEEDNIDEFDDIDEDDFDDDFDDDFEEELEDDYEIEIDDEISAEFGLSTKPTSDDDIEIDDELDDFEDFDKID